MKSSNIKKIVAAVIIIIIIFSVGGAATIIGIGQNVDSSRNVDSSKNLPANSVTGEYSIEISSNTQWYVYLIIDGQTIQKSGTGNATIDLGQVNSYASITVDQEGVGTTSAVIKNANGDTVSSDNTDSAANNVLFFYLKVGS